jgi:hypothetical protein
MVRSGAGSERLGPDPDPVSNPDLRLLNLTHF